MGILRKSRYYYQRAERGWSDWDAVDACSYIARVIGGTVDRLADINHGVGIRYLPDHVKDYNDATPEDWEEADINQTADFRKHAEIFTRYAKGDAWSRPDHIEKTGGVSFEELDEALTWFHENFQSLWD